MNAPLAIVTGFGPFLSVPANPSQKVAKILQSEPPAEAEVRALELPVSFTSSKDCLDRFLAELPRPPKVLLGLGAHRNGFFRLESRARPVLDSVKPDNDGRFAAEVSPLGERELRTSFELERFATCLAAPELEPVVISNEAGGYVCELTYYALLEAAERFGIPALFLHVPPSEFMKPERQATYVRALLAELISACE